MKTQIRLSGTGGQGIIKIAVILADACLLYTSFAESTREDPANPHPLTLCSHPNYFASLHRWQIPCQNYEKKTHNALAHLALPNL